MSDESNPQATDLDTLHATLDAWLDHCIVCPDSEVNPLEFAKMLFLYAGKASVHIPMIKDHPDYDGAKLQQAFEEACDRGETEEREFVEKNKNGSQVPLPTGETIQIHGLASRKLPPTAQKLSHAAILEVELVDLIGLALEAGVSLTLSHTPSDLPVVILQGKCGCRVIKADRETHLSAIAEAIDQLLEHEEKHHPTRKAYDA